jgi:hypothetical protein
VASVGLAVGVDLGVM